MTRRSIDSERPIMAPSIISSKRASQRYSTYSNYSPSFTSGYTTHSATSDSTQSQGMQEIKNLTKGLDRLENEPLSRQRYQPTEQKSDTLSKLALGAKLERALGRRMTNQDAVYKPRTEKTERAMGTLGGVNEKIGAIKA